MTGLRKNHTAALDKVFARIVELAAENAMCPKAGPGFRSDETTSLARMGSIKVDGLLGGGRVITILTGEHAGKSTFRPEGSKVISITDHRGFRYLNEKPTPKSPTARRLIPYAGMERGY